MPADNSTDALEGVTLEVKAAATDTDKLVENTDYTVTWSYATTDGKTTGTATITGTGNYTGKITVNFAITKKEQG